MQPNQHHTPFQWGFSSLGAPSYSLSTLLKLADEFKLAFIELRFLENSADLPTRLASESREHYNQSPVSIRALLSDFNLAEADAADRKELLRWAHCAESWDIPFLRVFGGPHEAKFLNTQQRKDALKNLNWWYKQRKNFGYRVDIALETHSACSTAQSCLDLQTASGRLFPIIWDTHHTLKAGEALRESWQLIKDSIVHVHVKDSISTPSTHHPYTYVLPGKGNIPVPEILALLTEGQYTKGVSLEWELKWHPCLPTLRTALTHAQLSWF